MNNLAEPVKNLVTLQTILENKDRTMAFEKSLPKNAPSSLDNFKMSMYRLVEKNPKVLDCKASSVLLSFYTCLSLGLEPDTALQHAHLIPYGDQLQFQIGYKGLIALAYRSGLIRWHLVDNIYSNDKYSVHKGSNPRIEHEPALSNRGNFVASYAVVELSKGGQIFDIMTSDEIAYLKATSVKKSKNPKTGKYEISSSSPWVMWEDEMRKKTVLKRLLKQLPLTKEMALAKQIDDDVETGAIKDFRESTEGFQYEKDVIIEQPLVTVPKDEVAEDVDLDAIAKELGGVEKV